MLGYIIAKKQSNNIFHHENHHNFFMFHRISSYVPISYILRYISPQLHSDQCHNLRMPRHWNWCQAHRRWLRHLQCNPGYQTTRWCRLGSTGERYSPFWMVEVPYGWNLRTSIFLPRFCWERCCDFGVNMNLVTPEVILEGWMSLQWDRRKVE